MTASDTVKAWVMALVLLGVGAWLMTRLPDAKALREKPFEQAAAANDEVQLRTASVKLVDLDASKQIFVPSQTDANGSNTGISQHGIFLVPTIIVRGRHEPTAVGNLTILARDGRLFGGAQAIGGNGCGTAPPDLPVQCQLIFEMDKAALVGAKLQIPALGLKGDDVAIVDLGIDEAKAKALAAHDNPIKIDRMQPGWAATP